MIGITAQVLTAPSAGVAHNDDPAKQALDLELNPRTPGSCLQLGTLLAELGRHQEAIANCNKVLDLTQRVVDAYLLRGQIFLNLGRRTDAIGDFTAALAIEPGNARAYRERGLAHVQEQRFDQAVADLGEAIRLDPNCASAYAHRSLAYQQTGQHPDEALHDMARALLLDRQYALAYCSQLGEIHRADGERELAAADEMLAECMRQAAPGAELEVKAEAADSPIPVAASEPERKRAGGGETRGQPMSPKLKPAERKVAPSPAETCLNASVGTQIIRTSRTVRREPTLASQPAPTSPLADDPSAFDREQALVRAQERDREQERRREFKRIQDRLAAASKPVPVKPKRLRPMPDEENDTRLPTWKKGALAAAALFGIYWLGTFCWDWFQDHRARAPLTAERVVVEFTTDPEVARQKYAGNIFEVTGTIKVVPSDRGPRVLFETPDTADCTLECVFPSPAEARRLQTGQLVTIEGECSLRPQGNKTLVVLGECIVRKGL
jgi:Flp pilus assembly protein TadD